MSDVKKIKVGDNTYDVKDDSARVLANQNKDNLTDTNNNLSGLQQSFNGYKTDLSSLTQSFGSHNHNGSNTSKIKWGDIDEVPTVLQKTTTKWLGAGETFTIGDLTNGVYLATTERGTAGGSIWVLLDGLNTAFMLHGGGQYGDYSYSGNSLIIKAHSGGGENFNVYRMY